LVLPTCNKYKFYLHVRGRQTDDDNPMTQGQSGDYKSFVGPDDVAVFWRLERHGQRISTNSKRAASCYSAMIACQDFVN